MILFYHLRHLNRSIIKICKLIVYQLSFLQNLVDHGHRTPASRSGEAVQLIAVSILVAHRLFDSQVLPSVGFYLFIFLVSVDVENYSGDSTVRIKERNNVKQRWLCRDDNYH